MRTVGAKEVAESRELLEHVLSLYHEVEKSATMETILFPWLPGKFFSPSWMSNFPVLSFSSRTSANLCVTSNFDEQDQQRSASSLPVLEFISSSNES